MNLGSSAILCRGLSAGAVVSDNPLRRANALRSGESRNMRWSVVGGGTNFGVYVALGTSREDGTLPQNGFDRTSLRFSSRWAPTSSLVVEGGFGYMFTRTAHPQNGDNPEFGLLAAATLGNPLTVGSRSDGALNAPVYALTTIDQLLRVNRATPTIQITHDPNERLHQRLTIGVDVSNSVGRFFVPLRYDSAFAAGDNEGIVRGDHQEYQVSTVDYLATVTLFDHPVRGFSAKASAGAQYVETSDDLVIASGFGLVSNFASRVADAKQRTGTARGSGTRSLGTFGQMELSFLDRLFIQAGTRADRHSAFGSRAGPQWLPKYGISWVAADGERTQSRIPVLQTLRMRAAYGTSGRAPPQGQSGATYAAAPVMVGPTSIIQGLAPVSRGNPALRPERGTELELGFDAGVLGDRLALEFTYFDKRSTDLLYNMPQPPSLGFPADPIGNVDATIKNTGIEATLRWNSEIRSRHLDAYLGASTLRNVAPLKSDLPIGARFDYRIVAIDSVAGRVVVTDSAQFIGPSIPARVAFMGSTIELLRGVRLHVALDGKWGYWQHNQDTDIRDRVMGNSERAVRAVELNAADRLAHFGPFVKASGATVSQTQVLGPYLQDASFLRWRELSLTWDSPRAVARRIGATAASVTVAGRNLQLWTRYEGDPEVVSMISENANGGLGQYDRATFLTMPQARRWITRVNLGF